METLGLSFAGEGWAESGGGGRCGCERWGVDPDMAEGGLEETCWSEESEDKFMIVDGE
jgi:hypothetical protein